MKILALDPATKCGWCISPEIGGMWDLAIRRDESRGMKLIRLQSKLRATCLDGSQHLVGLVVFEAARHAAPGRQGALVVQAELQSVIKLFCEEQGIDYRGYSPTEIKRHATGGGNSSKPKVAAATKEKYPQANIVDDNHADALALWSLASEEYGNASHSCLSATDRACLQALREEEANPDN